MMDDAPPPACSSAGDRHEKLIDAARQQVAAIGARRNAVPDQTPETPHQREPRLDGRLADSFPGYQILGEVHRGGQGIVYQALQKSTDRRVAIKVMREGPFAGPADKARFEREVHALGQLSHPNIVAIHDSGVTTDTGAGRHHYFVMDFIAGQALDAYVAGTPRNLKATLALFAQICEAVNAAHLHGVIHRDLKPSNIRIDADGQPYILDFGLAKSAGLETETVGLTLTGQFVGSLPWASPEQAEGSPGQIDIRTDVYSLGVLLYQLLTGKFPYEVVGSMREVLDRIVHAEPVRPSTIGWRGRPRPRIDDEVETIILKCLQKDPGRRYQTAGELAVDLRRYLTGEPIDAKRDSTLYVLRKQLRRHRLPLAVGAAFLLLLAVSAVVASWLYVSADRERTVAIRQTQEAGRATERAQKAERDATERLWDSYLAQARATRALQRPGQRFDSLAALHRAALIRPSLELRNEAIACMTLADIRTVRELSVPAGFGTFAATANLERIALGEESGLITIVSGADGRPLQRLIGPELHVVVMVLSPDERYLAVKYHTGDRVRTLIWDLTSGTQLFETSPNAKRALTFGPDSTWVAVGQGDHAIHFYRLPGGEPWLVLGPGPNLGHLDADPTGRKLAAASLDRPAVTIWDLETAAVSATIDAPAGIHSVRWSPDGALLAGAGQDHHVYVWDAHTGEVVKTLAAHKSDAVRVKFAPRHRLVSEGWDSTAWVWDLDTGQAILGPIGPTLDLLDPGGSRAVSARRGFEFKICELKWGDECRTLRADEDFGGGASVTVSPDGRLLATGGAHGLILWNLETGVKLGRLANEPCPRVLFRNDGILLAGTKPQVRRWEVRVQDDRVDVQPREPIAVQASAGLAVLDDGREIVGVEPSRVVVYEPQQRRERLRLGPYPGLAGLTVSPDSRWAFTGTWQVMENAAGRLWDLASGELVKSFPATAISGAFSPDERWLVVSTISETSPGSHDGYTFYEVGSWQSHHTVARAELDQAAGKVAFSSDGNTVALSDSRTTVQLVRAATGELLARLTSPGGNQIADLCFSPDGTGLVVLSAQQAVEIWDLRGIRAQLREMGLDWD